MTFHEHLVKEVLDSFDKGILTRERLELLCNDMLKGDSLFTELYAEHISSKSEQEAVIKFLKKELIHKTCYKQVMKRQYRELKQQMRSDNERYTKMYAELVTKKQSITWHRLEENPKDLPRNEGWVCNQDGLPCWYDITNDQWIDCEGTQIKTTAWCDMPHTRG